MLSQQRIQRLNDRFRTINELFAMLLRNGRWWVIPIFAIVVVLSLALVLLQAVPYVAPFIYAIL
jgi:hypothetical protein